MKQKESSYSWKLQDIIFVAMLCVVFGVVYLAGVYLISPLTAIFAPLGVSLLGTEMIFGIWFMAATLAAYILQKPGAAIIAEVLASLIEVLLGNMYGPMVIVAGIVQGAGAELVFAAWRYKRFDRTTMYLASVGCTITGFLWSFVRSNYLAIAPQLLVVYFVVRLISSFIFSGVLCKLMGDSLACTGLLKSYALGRAMRDE
nr:ECF transporter S component [Fournierella massiliensis]